MFDIKSIHEELAHHEDTLHIKRSVALSNECGELAIGKRTQNNVLDTNDHYCYYAYNTNLFFIYSLYIATKYVFSY